MLPYLRFAGKTADDFAALAPDLAAGASAGWREFIEQEKIYRELRDRPEMRGHALWDHLGQYEEPENGLFFALARAAQDGDMPFLRRLTGALRLLPLSPEGEDILGQCLRLDGGKALLMAARAGHAPVMRHYLAALRVAARKPDDMRKWLDHDLLGARLLVTAAAGGHDDIADMVCRFARRYDREKDIVAPALCAWLCHACEKGTAAALWTRLAGRIGVDYPLHALTGDNDELRRYMFSRAVKDQEGSRQLLRQFAQDRPHDFKKFLAAHMGSLFNRDMEAESVRFLLDMAQRHLAPAQLAKSMRQDEGYIPRMIAAQEAPSYGADISVIPALVGGDDAFRRMVTAQDNAFLHHLVGEATVSSFSKICTLVANIAGTKPLRHLVENYDGAVLQQRSDPMKMLVLLADIGKNLGVTHSRMPAHLYRALLDHKEKKLARHEFLQIAGGRAGRWREITGALPPDGIDPSCSPYRFKPALYQELLEPLRLAATLGRVKKAEDSAYKLAVMFANRQEAERYLDQAVKAINPEEKHEPLDKACSFILPEKGLWDAVYWKTMLQRHGMKAGRYLPYAPAIETHCRDQNKSLPADPAQLREIAALVVYEYGEKTPEWAALALDYHLDHELYAEGAFLLTFSGKTADHMPDVMIDGADIGVPNYYMTKLAANDPRGLILGHLTNNCQHLGGNGEYAAVLGMVSPDSGFYIWQQKTKGRITPQDRIVAQSWAWLADDRQALVFDSFERLSDSYNHLARPFLAQCAYDLKQAGTLSRVFLGAGGGTPDERELQLKPAANDVTPLVEFERKDSAELYDVPALDLRAAQKMLREWDDEMTAIHKIPPRPAPRP